MFDKSYFNTSLADHIKAAGDGPLVEVHLINGQGHRVRSVVEATEGYVVLEAYQRRGELTGNKGRWQGASDTSAGGQDLHQAVVSYHTIAQIVITPTDAAETPRIGFSRL